MKKIFSILLVLTCFNSHGQYIIKISNDSLCFVSREGTDSFCLMKRSYMSSYPTMSGNQNVTNKTFLAGNTWNGNAIGDAYISSAATWNAKQNSLGFTAVPDTRTVNGQALSSNVITDVDLLAYAALGSPILAETVQQKLAYSNVSTNMVDGQVKYTAVYLPRATTLTGVKFYVRVLGAYTGDNNNRIGLYTYLNGTLTLVASSANNATLWTNAANSIQTIPFSSPYVANSGLYYVAFLYNQSVQTTAPALASGVAMNNLAMSSTAMGFTNSAKLHGTSNATDLPASIAMTSITASTIPSWVSLY